MKKTFILFFLKGIGAVASLILGMLVSKYFGLEILGQYGLLISYILIFSIIATWGVNIYIIESQIKSLNINQFLFNLLFSIFVSLVSCVFFYNKFNIFYMGGAVFIASFLVCKSSFFMINGFQYYNSLLDDFFKYLFPILFLIIFYGYLNFFEIYFFSQLLLFLVSVFLFAKLIGLSKINSVNISNWKSSLFYGFFPTISALLVLLNAQFDRVILSYTVSKEMLGIYYAAQTIMALVTYMTVSVMMVITPRLIKLYRENNFLELREFSKKYSKLLVLMSTFIFIITVLFGRFLLNLYGINSDEGYKSLLILLLGVTISQFFGFGMTVYTYTQHKKRLIIYQLFVFILASVMCLFLSKLYGIIGAAFTTAFGLILIKVLIWFDFKKKGIQLGVV